MGSEMCIRDRRNSLKRKRPRVLLGTLYSGVIYTAARMRGGRSSFSPLVSSSLSSLSSDIIILRILLERDIIESHPLIDVSHKKQTSFENESFFSQKKNKKRRKAFVPGDKGPRKTHYPSEEHSFSKRGDFEPPTRIFPYSTCLDNNPIPLHYFTRAVLYQTTHSR